MMYLSEFEIAADIMLYKLSEDAKAALRRIDREDLIHLHYTVGRSIREEYLLWDKDNPYTMLNYQPTIVDGVDINPNHPDAVSHRVLELIWSRMQ